MQWNLWATGSTRWQTVMADDDEEEESERRSGWSMAFFIIGILPAEPASAFSMAEPVLPVN